MNVLIDTSIWSLAFRRAGSVVPSQRALIGELAELISEVRVAMIGPIRQEILPGSRARNSSFA